MLLARCVVNTFIEDNSIPKYRVEQFFLGELFHKSRVGSQDDIMIRQCTQLLLFTVTVISMDRELSVVEMSTPTLVRLPEGGKNLANLVISFTQLSSSTNLP